MNIVIRNEGNINIPVTQGTTDEVTLAWVVPDGSYSIDDPKQTVISIGENPSFIDEVKEAAAAIAEKLAALVTWWREREEKLSEEAPQMVSIENLGENSLRVLLGSNVEEQFIAAGASASYELGRYIEVREQGV